MIGFGIKLKQIDGHLFQAKSIKLGCCTIKELEIQLRRVPFQLNEIDASKLSKYLFVRSKPISNDSTTVDVSLIRASFLNGVGLWPCYDTVEWKILELQIKNNFTGIDIKNFIETSKNTNHDSIVLGINKLLRDHNKPIMRPIEEKFFTSKVIISSPNLKNLSKQKLIEILEELNDFDDQNQVVTAEELARYYEATNDRLTMVDKQMCFQQQNLLSHLFNQNQCSQNDILSNKNYYESEDDKVSRKFLQEQLLSNGYVRGISEPDLQQLQQLQRANIMESDDEDLQGLVINQKNNRENYDDQDQDHMFQEDDDDDDNDDIKWEQEPRFKGMKIRQDRIISKGQLKQASDKTQTNAKLSQNDRFQFKDNQQESEDRANFDQQYEEEDFEQENQ